MCPVTARDVEIYYDIYGDVEGAIKGKTVRLKPDRVDEHTHATPIPKSIVDKSQPLDTLR